MVANENELFTAMCFQCPYYIDGDVKLSQTFAILKYLGRKHNLAPKTEEEHIRVDLAEAEAIDMRTKWSTLCYNADFVSKEFLISGMF